MDELFKTSWQTLVNLAGERAEITKRDGSKLFEDVLFDEESIELDASTGRQHRVNSPYIVYHPSSSKKISSGDRVSINNKEYRITDEMTDSSGCFRFELQLMRPRNAK